MKQTFENLVKWVLASSADSTEISLTIKGALHGAIPAIMVASGFAHINLGDGSVLTAAFDAIAQLVQSVLTVIAATMTVYGALRKVYYLIVPNNTVTPST